MIKGDVSYRKVGSADDYPVRDANQTDVAAGEAVGEADGEVDGESDIVPVNRSIETLRGVSFSVKKGQLVAIVGPVGSGKSSLLSALLGELNLIEGAVRLAGSVAYCTQGPWILNATLKDNILFGRSYDEDLFDLAVHASSLEDDLKVNGLPQY